ncbi:hypothetical protein NQX30_03130 [Candidatus Persebacteraceae bacterium Df01]|uniref:Secreted protein n=1 Tax=Candidatus Doriopsillibacter californiensis TaxID=2970740 RepID=A0ABT7QKX6_9GAMM|nr:hypothetical protein [Candidatus Persebacteraceae bacterium Df01]
MENRLLPLLAILLLSNALGYSLILHSIFTDKALKWTLPSLVKEVHRPYPTAVKEVSSYLRHHAKQNDTIYAYP